MGSHPQHAPDHPSYLVDGVRRQPYPLKRIVDQFLAQVIDVLDEQLACDRFGEFGVSLEREHMNGPQMDVWLVRFEILC